MCVHCVADAVVGLERTFFNVSEDVGQVELCAVVYRPDLVCPISFPFIVSLDTSNGTAGKYLVAKTLSL